MGELSDLILMSTEELSIQRSLPWHIQISNYDRIPAPPFGPHTTTNYIFEKTEQYVSFDYTFIPALEKRLTPQGFEFKGKVGREPIHNEYNHQAHLVYKDGEEIMYLHSPTDDLNAGSSYGIWLYVNCEHPKADDARKAIQEFMETTFTKKEN